MPRIHGTSLSAQSYPLTFGELLRRQRKRIGMTQAELGALVGLSLAHISHLEKNQRLPHIKAVTEKFVTALGLQDDPLTAMRLIELAAIARNEAPPTSTTLVCESRQVIREEIAQRQPILPAQPTQLIGRDAEINRLVNRLLNHPGRLLTLVGPPGVGKTRLGLAVATKVQMLFADGVTFVPLAPLTDPELVASAILTALDVPDNPQNPKLPKLRLIEFLRRKQILLLLDNFEQLIPAAPLLAELLRECPQLILLVTSREHLHLRSEQRYRVAPLALHFAVELFVQRAQDVDPDFVLTATNEPVIGAICTRLDQLPLAIELVAAHSDLLTLPMLLTQVGQKPLDFVSDDASDLPERHQMLRTAIAWSYHLLDQHTQRLFRCLGVFAGSFTAQAALAVLYTDHPMESWPAHTIATETKRVMQGLIKLCNLHLLNGLKLNGLQEEQCEPRFLLLETIREYALEQSHAHNEIATVQRRHANYYLTLAKTDNPFLCSLYINRWQAELACENDNLRQALTWFQQAPDGVEESMWLAAALWTFWLYRGQLHEGRRWLELVLERAEKLKIGPSSVYAYVLAGACLFAFYQRDLRVAEDHAISCLFLYQQVDDHWGRAFGLGLKGLTRYAQGDVAAGIAFYQESLIRGRAVGDPWQIAMLLCQMSKCLLVAGDSNTVASTDHIYDLLTEAFGLSRTVGEPYLLAMVLRTLGRLTMLQNKDGEATGYFLESLTLCRNIGDLFFTTLSLYYLAELAQRQGNKVQSSEWAAECAQLQSKLGIEDVQLDDLSLL